MSRTTKKILGPIATDANLWPPMRRGNDDDQEKLEWLLNLELDAWWRAIAQEDGVTENEHIGKERRNRRKALDRAGLRDMELLQRFVANSTGPDGKPLGETIAKFVRDNGKTRKKTDLDYFDEAQKKEWLQKKTEAVWEADRAKAILERVYGRTPDGYTTRTDLVVAAERTGVDPQVIKEWKRDRRCPDDPWAVHQSNLRLAKITRDAAAES